MQRHSFNDNSLLQLSINTSAVELIRRTFNQEYYEQKKKL